MVSILVVNQGDIGWDSAAAILGEIGCCVYYRTAIQEALETLRLFPIDVVMIDIRSNDQDGGLMLLQSIMADFRRVPVVVCTAFPRIQDAVRAGKLGASDYLELPIQSARMRAAIATAVSERATTCVPSGALGHTQDPFSGIVARSAAMRATLDWAARVGPSNIPVLLTGETGTGKELLARAVHEASHRRAGPFVAINCGAIPENLFESELFGYQKGAFTGAHSAKAGLLEAADGGTVLLDEVGEMPLGMQVRLLRFLESSEVRRLGQTKSRSLDVRVIAATNRNLREDVARGRCRADFYFRLTVGACHIPPLRERREDIDALVPFWITKLARTLAPHIRGVSPRALARLRAYSWPGNVRELRSVLEHMLVLARGELIMEADVAMLLGVAPDAAMDTAPDGPGSSATEWERLVSALERHRWNRNRAAESLGISRSTLWRRLGRYSVKQGGSGS